MNPQDFESSFAEHDVARNLSALSEAELDALVSHATQTTAPTIRRPRNRKALLTGAAAVATLAIAIPSSLSAPQSADAPFLTLAAGSNASETSAKMGMQGKSAVSSDLAGMAMFTPFHYTFDAASLNSPFGAVHFAYKFVARDDVDSVADTIINQLGVEDVIRHVEGGNHWWTNVETSKKYVYIYDGPWASWSYYDANLDSFACVDVKQTSGMSFEDTCHNRIPKNLPSKSEALAKAKVLASEFGYDMSDDWRWTTEENTVTGESVFTASIGATANLYVNGIASPISVSFSFADNGELFAAWGSLQKLVFLGDYKIASPEDALNRANDATEKMFIEMRKNNQGQTTMPLAPSPGKSEDGTGSSDGAAPAISTWDPQPTEVVVEKLTVSMVLVNDSDGNQLWIPAYEVQGHTTGVSDSPSGPMGQIIAVDSSQIDLSKFYQFGGFFTDAVAR